jgi:NAD(P)-dependent dehydrogenase (short-subunit alcohol dehydrogenase family)
MNQHLFIITGASRGMGLAMAQQLMRPHHFLLCISRQQNDGLVALAKGRDVGLEQWPLDLDHGFEAAAMLTQWLEKAGKKTGQFASSTLINNAALLPAISPLSAASTTDIAKVLRVGLEAPMQLTAAFLRATEGWRDAAGEPITRKVLNISSGNGRRAMAAQSIYSASKAGMDHFTRCVALEEAAKPHGAKLCSLAPGVIDTDMQTQLRAADAQNFPAHAVFVDLKTQGKLSSADQAASAVLAFLNRADFGDNPVADVRDVA